MYPLIKNIDVLRVYFDAINKDSYMYAYNNANDRVVDYLLTTFLCENDLATGNTIMQLDDVYFNIKNIENEVIVRDAHIKNYLFEQNYSLKKLGSKINFKESKVNRAHNETQITMLPIWVAYAGGESGEFKFSRTKNVTVPANFTGKLSDLVTLDHYQRLVSMDIIGEGDMFITLRDVNNRNNYEYLPNHFFHNAQHPNFTPRFLFSPFVPNAYNTDIWNDGNEKKVTLFFQ